MPEVPVQQVAEVGEVLADAGCLGAGAELGLERRASEAGDSDGNFASIVSTAFPGINRGIAKLTVIATQAATA